MRLMPLAFRQDERLQALWCHNHPWSSTAASSAAGRGAARPHLLCDITNANSSSDDAVGITEPIHNNRASEQLSNLPPFHHVPGNSPRPRRRSGTVARTSSVKQPGGEAMLQERCGGSRGGARG
ncbi:hypothetical protein PGQ11_005605 [Apiospora arundinis]|uniref:Uncharacterized protein n=1 Tax=Apiospora arundinis TaxID=335852 RepID=A0ABR2JBL5_9PEZI